MRLLVGGPTILVLVKLWLQLLNNIVQFFDQITRMEELVADKQEEVSKLQEKYQVNSLF